MTQLTEAMLPSTGSTFWFPAQNLDPRPRGSIGHRRDITKPSVTINPDICLLQGGPEGYTRVKQT
jgi:hypothetical protein